SPSIRPASSKGECLSHLGFDDIRIVGQLSGGRSFVLEGGCGLDASSAIQLEMQPEVKSEGWACRACAASRPTRQPWRQSAVITVAVPHIADAIGNTGSTFV